MPGNRVRAAVEELQSRLILSGAVNEMDFGVTCGSTTVFAVSVINLFEKLNRLYLVG